MVRAQDIFVLHVLGPGQTPFFAVTLEKGLCEPNVICQFCWVAARAVCGFGTRKGPIKIH